MYQHKTVAFGGKFIRNNAAMQMTNQSFGVLCFILGDERILSKKCCESVEYINESEVRIFGVCPASGRNWILLLALLAIRENVYNSKRTAAGYP
jgi:hypothetical protein